MTEKIERELDALHQEIFDRYHDVEPDFVRIRHLWRGVDFLMSKKNHPSMRGFVDVEGD